MLLEEHFLSISFGFSFNPISQGHVEDKPHLQLSVLGRGNTYIGIVGAIPIYGVALQIYILLLWNVLFAVRGKNKKTAYSDWIKAF